MFDRVFLRILLSPFALLFGLGVSIKNFLYLTGLLKGMRFSVPVINVGNLTVGGAGKTPHTEYLVKLLSEYIHVAIMSRGYGRKTQGYVLASPGHTHADIGDEPLQYLRKFPNVSVAVSESRASGIPKLMQHRPQTQLILLDDAFQHRSIEAAYDILLTEHHLPYTRDYLLPSGRLREWRSAANRADIIIVTKCPPDISAEEKEKMIREIDPMPHQKVFFSKYRYKPLYNIFHPEEKIALTPQSNVLLVCAIARTRYLLDYLHGEVGAVTMLEFEDHHVFSPNDIEQIEKYYTHLPAGQNIIVTTEKDAMRLEQYRSFFQEKGIRIYALPVEVEFLFDETVEFNRTIRDFLLNYRY